MEDTVQINLSSCCWIFGFLWVLYHGWVNIQHGLAIAPFQAHKCHTSDKHSLGYGPDGGGAIQVWMS